MIGLCQYFGGYISYVQTGSTDYSFTFTTITDTSDRARFCSIPVEVTNNTGVFVLHRDTLMRLNGAPGVCDSLYGSGEVIGNGLLKNCYSFSYSFLSPDYYRIRFLGADIDSSIVNLGSGQPIYLGLDLFVSPFVAMDTGAIFLADSIPEVCIGDDLEFDCGWLATDSIVFTSVVPSGVTGYSFPTHYSDTFWVGRFDGVVHFENPTTEGTFVYAVRVTSYKDGIQVATTDAIKCISVGSCPLNSPDPQGESFHRISPNPVSEHFLIMPNSPGLAPSADQLPLSLRILDLQGREVLPERSYRAGDPPVDVSMLSAGVYVVQVRMRAGVENIKLVVN